MCYWSRFSFVLTVAPGFGSSGASIVAAKSSLAGNLPTEILDRDDLCFLPGSGRSVPCGGLLQVGALRQRGSEGGAADRQGTVPPVDCQECYHLPPRLDGSYAGLHCPCLEGPKPNLSLALSDALANQSDAPAMYIELMKSTVLNTVYNPKATARDGSEMYPECDGSLTMIGRRRLDNTHNLLLMVLASGVPGDFIETGSWRGGSTALATAVLQVYGQLGAKERWVWMADSFKGIPPVKPDVYPTDAMTPGVEKLNSDCVISPASVRRSFQLLGLPSEPPAVQILEGYFNETLQQPEQQAMFASRHFSLLRLDGDTYESTYQALEALYPHLSVGGFVVVDDYMDWVGARKATLDFRAEHAISSPIVAVYHENVRFDADAPGVRFDADAPGEIPRGVWWQKM